MQYGKTLAYIREKRAYTSEYVANEIGVSTDELTDIENQAQVPDTKLLTKLSDLYKVPLNIIEHLSIDHNINGNEDEQRRKTLKDWIAHAVFIDENYKLKDLSDTFKELRQLKTKREELKVS